MLLAIDIGNTNIVIGFFRGKRLIGKLRIKTNFNPAKLSREIKKGLNSFQLSSVHIDAAIVSSVVPGVSKVIVTILKRNFNIKPILLGKDAKVPIKNLYKKQKQVGQDRLVNAFACLKLYGAPAIIVDFGTATTFDYLDKRGSYAGGLITPGVEISIDALAQRTALLPKIKLKRPRALIGKDTAESIRSGVLYGLSSMCDGLIKKIRLRHSSEAKVVATGGLALFFSKFCRFIDCVDEDLTLKGLRLLYRK